MDTRRSTPVALTLTMLSLAAPARAQAPLVTGLGGPEDYGESCLYANDDGSSVAIDLTDAFPAGLQFFTMTHTAVYVNTNGNITFSGPLSDYTPDRFAVADRPMIAPYWADVDTRPESNCERTPSTMTCGEPADNGVWWDLESGRMVVTWDDVGYFMCHEDRRMAFQLVLTAVPTCGGGSTDFDVEFRFARCEWETGDASGGTDGFGGTQAQSGFDAGNGVDFVMIPGSRMAGIAERLCTESNVGVPGIWQFQIRSGAVVCPDAGEACDTGMTGVCGEGVMQCVGTGIECQPVVPAADERCDSLDNDCDGSIDEGDSICGGSTEVCDRGVCVDVCFEGGCPEGQLCTAEGRCVDASCEDVECEAGERCVLGTCADACEGVVCPVGQDCRGGRCLDLCADITCDPACTVCSHGECVPRCDLASESCGAGESCTEDGSCEPTACIGVSCDPGLVCVPGEGCVDACRGVVCPSGEECREGLCTEPEPPVVTDPDAGPADVDAGDVDAGADAGLDRVPPPPGSGRRGDDGCGCSAAGAGGNGLPLTVLAVLLGLVLGLAVGLRRCR